MEDLANAMGAGAFAWTLEFLGEGERAKTKRSTSKAPHHKEALVSLYKRWPEINAFMQRGPSEAAQYLQNLALVLSYRKKGLEFLFGLQEHPALKDLLVFSEGFEEAGKEGPAPAVLRATVYFHCGRKRFDSRRIL